MNIFDYTERGRRPSAKQILSDWKKAGKPEKFQVEYGESFAEFERHMPQSFPYIKCRWYDFGNGGSGIKRGDVVRMLEVECNPPYPEG